jgi:DNA-binding NtrC family response regulator
MNTYRIAVIDDDLEACESLMRALGAHEIVPPEDTIAWTLVTKAENVADEVISAEPHVVVLDLCLDSRKGVESGFEILELLTKTLITTRVIVLTGHGETSNGVRALNSGAASFLQKPADIFLLVALIKDSITQAELRSTVAALKYKKGNDLTTALVGTSPAVRELRHHLEFACAVSQSVLLLGETGTGKGFCARLIHRMGKRASGRFIRCQPQFGSADLSMSELFGHVRGAFTGAGEGREGLLAAADKGTLFIDEVDQFPLETQVALLEVLQEKVFRPIGSDKEVASNFRLICATNRDPLEAIESNDLRKDFYHRIAHLNIQIPPLRDRKEDIPLLAEAALQQLYESEELVSSSFSPKALYLLQSYEWPGNIRELHAVVESAGYRAQFAGRRIITQEDVEFSASESPKSSGESEQECFHSQVEEFKRKLVSEALHRHGGNKLKAAQELGLDRGTLRRLLAV